MSSKDFSYGKKCKKDEIVKNAQKASYNFKGDSVFLSS